MARWRNGDIRTNTHFWLPNQGLEPIAHTPAQLERYPLFLSVIVFLWASSTVNIQGDICNFCHQPFLKNCFEKFYRCLSVSNGRSNPSRYAPFHLAIALGGKKQIMLLPVTRVRSKIRLQRGSIRSVFGQSFRTQAHLGCLRSQRKTGGGSCFATLDK